MYILGLTSPECHRKSFPKVSTDPKCRSISDYAINIKFELNQIKQPSTNAESYLENFYVRILFNGTPVTFCPITSVKFGDKFCRFDYFREYLGDQFIMENSKRFCGVEESKAYESLGLWVALFIISCTFILFLLILLLNMVRHLRMLKSDIATRILMNHDHFTVEGENRQSLTQKML